MKQIKSLTLNSKTSRVTIFFVEAICMILELCSSYLLYPYFGNSNTVWIAIITVILLSNCLGNLIGGRICIKSKETETKYTGSIFFMIAMFISLILGLNEAIIFIINKLPLGNSINSFLCAFLLFLPCELLLGTIPPQIMYYESERDEYNPNKTGLIYALSTMGGLFGTVLGGFVLIPMVGCKYIIASCVIVTLIFALLYEPKFFKKFKNILCLIIAIGVLIPTFAYKESYNWENDPHGNMKVDSEYNRIVIQNSFKGDYRIRDMIMASGYESSTYLDKEKRNDLVFDYLKELDNIIYKNSDIQTASTLMIGGAAYQFPKYLISHYKNKSIDVVEIDKTVTDLAKKYFFLQDCINEFDKKQKRINLINDDGRVFLKDAPKYDIIYNDAFAGDSPVATLSTKEFVKLVEKKLNKNGIYAMNIISTIKGDKERFLCSECKTLSQVFTNVYVFQCSEDKKDDERQNLLVIATNRQSVFTNSLKINYSSGKILTDDYCPVEYLNRK